MTDKQIFKTMTGEIFLPIRLYYKLHSKSGLQAKFTKLRCMDHDRAGDRWVWLYDGEAKGLMFSVPYSSLPPHHHPIVLGSFYFRKNGWMYLDVGSVDRAVKAVEFSNKHVKRQIAEIEYVAIYNKVCSSIDEHPGSCFDKIFSGVRIEEIDRTMEEIIEEVSRSMEEGRITEMMDAKNFELVEAFPTHYYEDGIHSLEASLSVRETVAVARWNGRTDYRIIDLVKDVTRDLHIKGLN